MREDPDNHRRLLDGGDDLQLATALRAVFEVQVENALEQEGPGHQRGQPLHEFQWQHPGVRDAVAPRALELQLNLSYESQITATAAIRARQ